MDNILGPGTNFGENWWLKMMFYYLKCLNQEKDTFTWNYISLTEIPIKPEIPLAQSRYTVTEKNIGTLTTQALLK